MDLSRLTFFFPPIVPSTAENKLNLFLCFASPFLPFLFQIAKKTSLRWREGRRKKGMENVVCAGMHLLSACLGSHQCGEGQGLFLRVKTGIWECPFPLM